MRWHNVLIGVAYAIGAVLLALAVILPVFAVINLIYNDGNGIMPLLITIVVAWSVLAWLLARRSIRL
ncbi:MAG: hypothetical protein AB7R89_15770 [Dehalococcoidia bacterium]